MSQLKNLLPDHAMAGVSLDSVCKSFGKHQVLHDIDLAIQGGEFVVFIGPSGCGKSTLLRLIAGLEEVTSGEISISGRYVTDEDPSDRGIAMVFQTYALYPHMSVAENMGFGLKVMGRNRKEIDSKVGAASDVLRLGDYLTRRPAQLSGGQRQRVAIGRAIVRDPEVFLFDEPLSNLDAELRTEMRIEIARLHRELRTTMIYVTHDQTEAMTLADKIVVLREGRIEQIGTPEHLYDDPDNMFVAKFIGSPKMNILSPELFEKHEDSGKELLPPTVPSGSDPAWVGIRPEHLRAAQDGESSIDFRLDFSEFLGGTSFNYGTIGDSSCIMQSTRHTDAKPGETFGVTADACHIFLFDKDQNRIR